MTDKTASAAAGGYRPTAHEGLDQGELPPLQPVKGGRTPLETLSKPQDGPTEEGSDVLERLRKLRLAETASGDPRRHWGEPERLARDLLEERGGKDLEDDEREELDEALEATNSNAVDADSFGLLHYASMYGDVSAVACLIKKHANLNGRTKVHETPLILAAYYRHTEVCALLMTHRARPDLADWQGRTALAAAKASRCGRGTSDNSAAQASCIALLEEVAAKAAAAGPPKELEELRLQGNGFFKSSHYGEALAAYSLALAHLDDAGVYANRAACHLQLGKPMEAKLDAKKAIGLSGEAGHLKASWRLAKACLGLGELSAAEEALEEGLAKWPGDVALRQLKNEVELKRRESLGK